MSFLGFRERIELRSTILAGIENGRLPQSAVIVLHREDAFSELEKRVFDQAHADLATGVSAGSPAHPVLTWIVSHAPQIMAFVLALLPLFGVNVPPIAIPGLPPVTPKTDLDPADAPGEPILPWSDKNPTQPTFSSHGGTSASAFSLPETAATLAPFLAQFAAEVAASLLPQVEAKLEAWLKSRLPART